MNAPVSVQAHIDEASDTERFFSTTLAEADSEIASVVRDELRRQQYQIELIASENIDMAFHPSAVLPLLQAIDSRKFIEITAWCVGIIIPCLS